MFYIHVTPLFILVNILLLKYLIENLEKKNGNAYEEIASGCCSGKSRIKLLHTFPLENKNNAFLLLLKTNRIIYKSSFSLYKPSDQLRLVLTSRIFPGERYLEKLLLHPILLLSYFIHYKPSLRIFGTKLNRTQLGDGAYWLLSKVNHIKERRVSSGPQYFNIF